MKTFQEFLNEATDLHHADHVSYHQDMADHHEEKAESCTGEAYKAHWKAHDAHCKAILAQDSHEGSGKYPAPSESVHAKSLSQKADNLS